MYNSLELNKSNTPATEAVKARRQKASFMMMLLLSLDVETGGLAHLEEDKVFCLTSGFLMRACHRGSFHRRSLDMWSEHFTASPSNSINPINPFLTQVTC